MTSIFPPGFSQFLATLRTLPLWILAGVTLASLGVLYAPEFGGVSLGEFRGAIGPYIWAGCIAFGILRPHQALAMRCPATVYSTSSRRYHGLPEIA